MIVIYLDHITRGDVQQNPRCLFIFGDNCLRKGLGGQAKEIRGEPNAIGICVKRLPGFTDESFYSDSDYQKNTIRIMGDVKDLVEKTNSGFYQVIVMPSAGIGTGLAQLETRAPQTKLFLDGILRQHGIKNGVK